MFRVQERKYHAVPTPLPTEAEREAMNMRPPGVYKCPECRDATIVWRTTVDKYKVKCPKCSTDMVRVNLTPKPVIVPVAVPVAISTNELDELTEQYAEQYGGRATFRKAIKGGPAALGQLRNKL